ncbi:MAG: hypothetical protein WCR80_02630 [Bacilli bacterium]
METKKYYNSQEWGILKQDLGNQRSNGSDFLREMGFNITNNISLYPEQFYNELESLHTMMNEAKASFIVIFDPIASNIKRCSIPGEVTSLNQVMEFIKSNNLNLSNYKITFIERLLEIPDSFCGVVMTNGKADTIIEILLNSINLVDLTSAGVDPSKIQYYDFYYFDESLVVPRLINRIKLDCEHFKGYYEFIYGKYNGTTDIYYTYYSDNKEYTNIFEQNPRVLSLKKTNLY